MSDNELPSSLLDDVDLQYSLFPDLPDLANDDGLELSPLDRWKNSPPDTEAARLSDIVNSITIANSKDAYPIHRISQDSKISQRRRRSHHSPPSVAASDSTRSSVSSSSASSGRSFASNLSGSFGRFYAGVPARRRRRRQRKNSPAAAGCAVNQSPIRPYQCTFCTDTFKSKHDWVRHEKSLHLSLESWTCSPSGPTYKDGSSLSRCVFCNIERPSATHIRDHRFWECQEKPPTLRTFYRKDHLFQHLRLVHGAENGTSQVEAWRSEVTHINSRCGFCAETFTLWMDRNDHLAAHFREGLLMKEWKGCRGLDPAVALAVENAMPPYLIGSESTGVDPFSASKRCADSSINIDRSIGDGSCLQRREIQPTPFEQLTEHLIRFVQEKQTLGVSVTDDSIQQEARFFVYGDEDPWNQTAADNPDWLQLFKDGMGLGSSLSFTDNNTAGVSLKPSFPLPWTTSVAGDHGPQWHPNSDVYTLASPVDPWMPWAWQSPECLSEFRRSNNTSGSCHIPQQK